MLKNISHCLGTLSPTKAYMCMYEGGSTEVPESQIIGVARKFRGGMEDASIHGTWTRSSPPGESGYNVKRIPAPDSGKN